MSYDVNLTIATSSFPQAERHIVFETNVTFNVSRMWSAGGFDLKEWHGKPVTEVIPALQDIIQKMEESPWIYFPLQPKNGWGSYHGCLSWMRELLGECVKHDLTTFEVYF